jgi:hypothetical protein
LIAPRLTGEVVEHRRQCRRKEEIMFRKSPLFAITVLGLSLTAPAMALNPQPLPPGRYLPAQGIMPHTEHAGSMESQRIIGRYRPLPRCRSVQVGDPRKQPAMLVCS